MNNECFFPETNLYAKDNHGTIRVWSIAGEWTKHPMGVDRQIMIKISHGVNGGERNENYEHIDEGLAGRTIEEQAHSRINSRINKKIDSGYVRSIDEARDNRRVNALGLFKPMLAQKFKDNKNKIPWKDGVFIQRKYDGHRCLITNFEGRIIAYTRAGKEITSIGHITCEFEHLMEGETIDGELYHHGTKLQTIGSWVKKKQPETKLLRYMAYDLIADYDYEGRLEMLRKIVYKAENTLLAETTKIMSQNVALQLFANYRRDGYEGAIIRINGLGYEDGKRSKYLVKMKEFMDEEFLVVGITRSSEGWAILNCVTKDGKKFTASSPGSVSQKQFVYDHKDNYIGRSVQIEFAGWTLEGKPSQPIALRFRDKNDD